MAAAAAAAAAGGGKQRTPAQDVLEDQLPCVIVEWRHARQQLKRDNPQRPHISRAACAQHCRTSCENGRKKDEGGEGGGGGRTAPLVARIAGTGSRKTGMEAGCHQIPTVTRPQQQLRRQVVRRPQHGLPRRGPGRPAPVAKRPARRDTHQPSGRALVFLRQGGAWMSSETASGAEAATGKSATQHASDEVTLQPQHVVATLSAWSEGLRDCCCCCCCC